MLQVGGLIKRLDTGEGSYAKELEEDYDVADQLDQVRTKNVPSSQRSPCAACTKRVNQNTLMMP